MQTLIVFSHLRWDFVYQRPQQLMSRLARHYRIIFIEEPEPRQQLGEQGWQANEPFPGVTVLRLMKPVQRRGFDHIDPQSLRDKLAALGHRCPAHIAWLYTPMAMPLLVTLDPQLVIYDCMDELSAFMDPPAGLIGHEQQLLERADLVFTGGPGLYASKSTQHPNVHCFPSSVDSAHFRKALDRNIAYAPHATLPKPRLGFFGVLDERLDTALIAAIADAHTAWQLVLVGPVAKIDPASLPRRDNIHYMGQQAYELLPAFLASWDVCLMPFAINDATRFISPTKSLEYMAAELPVVSTPVRDVVAMHADTVASARSAPDFIRSCEQALAMPAAERQQKIRQMRAKLRRTSWDATVYDMHRLMLQAQGLTTVSGTGASG